MIFTKRKTRSMKKRSPSTLRCLQFVDGSNQEHYLFRVENSGNEASDPKYIDLKQTYAGYKSTVQSMIIQAIVENKSLLGRKTADLLQKQSRKNIQHNTG